MVNFRLRLKVKKQRRSKICTFYYQKGVLKTLKKGEILRGCLTLFLIFNSIQPATFKACFFQTSGDIRVLFH